MGQKNSEMFEINIKKALTEDKDLTNEELQAWWVYAFTGVVNPALSDEKLEILAKLLQEKIDKMSAKTCAAFINLFKDFKNSKIIALLEMLHERKKMATIEKRHQVQNGELEENERPNRRSREIMPPQPALPKSNSNSNLAASGTKPPMAKSPSMSNLAGSGTQPAPGSSQRRESMDQLRPPVPPTPSSNLAPSIMPTVSPLLPPTNSAVTQAELAQKLKADEDAKMAEKYRKAQEEERARNQAADREAARLAELRKQDAERAPKARLAEIEPARKVEQSKPIDQSAKEEEERIAKAKSDRLAAIARSSEETVQRLANEKADAEVKASIAEKKAEQEEEARKAAEIARKNEENARIQAEQRANRAEIALKNEENARKQAQQIASGEAEARKSAELARKSEETDRVTAEQKATDAERKLHAREETERLKAENAKKEAEAKKKRKVNKKVEAEQKAKEKKEKREKKARDLAEGANKDKKEKSDADSLAKARETAAQQLAIQQAELEQGKRAQAEEAARITAELATKQASLERLRKTYEEEAACLLGEKTKLEDEKAAFDRDKDVKLRMEVEEVARLKIAVAAEKKAKLNALMRNGFNSYLLKKQIEKTRAHPLIQQGFNTYVLKSRALEDTRLAQAESERLKTEAIAKKTQEKKEQADLQKLAQDELTKYVDILRSYLQSSDKPAWLENADALRQLVAAIDEYFKDEYTPLHLASALGDVKYVKELLERLGGPISLQAVTKSSHMTPLHVAAAYGQAEIVDALLAKGANAFAQMINGFTPLKLAIQVGQYDVVKMLLEKTAPNLKEIDQILGHTLLQFTVHYGDADVLPLLLDHDAYTKIKNNHDENLLHLAANRSSQLLNTKEVIDRLIEKGVDKEGVTIWGTRPIHGAAAIGNLEAVQALIAAKIDLKALSNDKTTALHVAAAANLPLLYNNPGEHNGNVVKALLEGGTEANALDKDGNTALHYAVAAGHVEVVKELLQPTMPLKKANKELKTGAAFALTHYVHAKGLTALEIVKAMQEKFYSANVPDGMDIDPIPKANRYAEIVRLLTQN